MASLCLDSVLEDFPSATCSGCHLGGEYQRAPVHLGENPRGLALEGVPCNGVEEGASPSTTLPLVREALRQGGTNAEGVHVVQRMEAGCGPAPSVFPLGEAFFHERVDVHAGRAHHTLAFAAPAVSGTLDG